MSMLRFETVERDSLFTRLDFRTKLLLIFTVMIIGILWESPITTAILGLGLFILCIIAGVKWSFLKSIIQMMIPFWIILIIIHGFFSDVLLLRLTGNETLTPLIKFPENWWLIGGVAFSLEGLFYSLNVIFKTLAMVLSVPLALFTTDVDSIVVGMVRSKIPYKVAFVFSSTLRFFPVLFEEIQMIIEAQRLRGLALENLGILKKAKVYSKIGIPLILSAMAKSQQLEVVLQAKGFCGDSNRTYLHDSDFIAADKIIMIILLLILLIAFVLYFLWGVGKFSWLIF